MEQKRYDRRRWYIPPVRLAQSRPPSQSGRYGQEPEGGQARYHQDTPKQTAKPTAKAEKPVPLHLMPDYAYEQLNLVADDEVLHGVQLGLIESRRA